MILVPKKQNNIYTVTRMWERRVIISEFGEHLRSEIFSYCVVAKLDIWYSTFANSSGLSMNSMIEKTKQYNTKEKEKETKQK